MSPSRSQRGFTLIEMLIVIVIIAVMSSLVVPAYARFREKVEFQAVVAGVQDLFAYAREQAIRNDTTVTLTLDAASGTLTGTFTPPQAPTDQPAAFSAVDTQDTGAITNRTYQLPAECTLSGFRQQEVGSGQGSTPAQPTGAPQMSFYADGTSDGTELTLAAADGYSARMRLWPATGKLALEGNDSGSSL